MKRFTILLIIFLFTSNFFSQESKKYISHVVKEGETLKSIAKIYDCKTKDIKNLNPDLKEDRILVNSVIVVPNNLISSKIVPKIDKNESQKITIYVVESGNTIFSIAKKYNVTMQSLKEANNLKDDSIIPGQKLIIPSKNEFTVSAGDKKAEFYQVKKGDTKWRIATLFNTNVDKIDELNPELKSRDLQESEYIWVPSNENIVSNEIKETYLQNQDENFIYHVVKEDETLFKIAIIYDTSEEEIQKLNSENLKVIRPGMLLKIPGKKKDKFISHTVKNGETIYQILKKYKITEKELYANNLVLSEGLKVGQLLFVKPKQQLEIKSESEKQEIFEEEITSETSFPNVKYDNSEKLHISFLMPIMKDSVVSFGQNTESSKLRTIITDFYMGAEMALKELTKKGMEIEYHIYDTENKLDKITKLVMQDDIKNSDLIIGPFFYDKAEYVAKRLNKIPVVVPLSKKLYKNNQENLIKAGVSDSAIAERLADYFVSKYAKQNIILVADFSEKNIETLNIIESTFKKNSIEYKVIKPIKNSKDETVLNFQNNNLQNAVLKEKKNLVILLSDNNSLNSTLITTYDRNPNDIKLYTLDKIKNLDNLNFSSLVNLEWTFATSFFENSKNEDVENFKKKYKEINYANPGLFAFTGYELVKDLILRIATGNLENSLETQTTKGLTRNFEYFKGANNDFTNKGVMFIKLNEELEFEIMD